LNKVFILMKYFSLFFKLKSYTIVSLTCLLNLHATILEAQNFQENMTGKDTYTAICSSCHGIDGHATLSYAPNFVDGERLNQDLKQLVESVREGLGRMPPQEADLSDDQIMDAIKYAMSLNKKSM